MVLPMEGDAMRLAAPEWLIFVPILIVVGWHWKHLALWRPLRAMILAGIVLLLTRPEWQAVTKGLDVWVLVDRSASAEDLLQPRLPEWEGILESSRQKEDRLFVTDFADSVVVRGMSDRELFDGNAQHTRLSLGIHHALSHMAADRASRILVLSDGFSTEPLSDLSERLLDQQVPLDFRLVADAEVGDVQVQRIAMPSRVQTAEPFFVEAALRGNLDQNVSYSINRNGARIGTGTARVEAGRGTIRFTDRLSQPGGHRYEVVIQPAPDAHPGNNIAENWIEVMGGPRVLLVSGYRSDPVADVLRAQGFDVILVEDVARLHTGDLSGVRAVMFNNVPAYAVSNPFLKALDFFVRTQGGGFLMAGGRFSFGSGGYFESAVDGLLPVSMDLREDHKKLAVAMAIVMDRSGSMGAGVAGGPVGATKMDLANEGAARAIELLGLRDMIAVFAVDSAAHEVVPLTSVGGVRNELMQTVRRIQSGGGGIFVYTGLKAAWDQLKSAEVGQRHIILFSDAADSEEPGAYKALIDRMTKAGTTVSVIGLGSDTDSDAELLRDIAARGNGRIFFNADPSGLPTLFAQEAVTVARSAFIEDPVSVGDAGGWLEIAARPMDWLDTVDGYNLSYLRPEATAAAVSVDEYAAPLIAYWQRGIGRVGVVSFPLAGEFSSRVRGWDHYGDMMQTLVRWLMGEDVPPGVGLQHRIDGTSLILDLLYDDRWEETVGRQPPRIFLTEDADDSVKEQVWERLEPGHYRATIPIEARTTARGAVQIGNAVLPFGPVTAGVNAEWSFDPERVEELRQLSRISGGEERLDLTKIWEAPRRSGFIDARPWMVVALLILVLAEALISRMGWSLPVFRPAPLRGRTRHRAATPRVPPTPGEAPEEAPDEKRPSPKEETRRRSRFARAKRR